MSNPTGYRKNEPTQPLRSGHPTVSANLQAATAPCGDVAPPVIDVTCGCLLRSPVKEDRDTVKRVRRSKATWGNIIASRYRGWVVSSWDEIERSTPANGGLYVPPHGRACSLPAPKPLPPTTDATPRKEQDPRRRWERRARREDCPR